MKKILIFSCFFLFQLQIRSQSLIWSGAGGDNNFFNELNWFDTATGQPPETGSIDPFEVINFDLNLTCNAVASSIAGLGVSISSQSPEIFNPGPNEIWPFVFNVASLEDGNNGVQQTLKINIVSLPDEGAYFRIIRTVANGNWYFPNSTPLSLGLNTLSVSSVNYDRSVKIQFSTGDITFDHISLNDELIYATPLESIVLQSNKNLNISNSTLEALSISGGEVNLAENSYLNLTDEEPLNNNVQVNFNNNISWLRLENIKPNIVFQDYLNQFNIPNLIVDYPENIRLDNYYDKGTLIRSDIHLSAPLVAYDQNNFNGQSANFYLNDIYSGNTIPNGLDNSIKSFILKKGYMLTVSDNDDGTGKSKVFIASEDDLHVSFLPDYLDSIISYLRIVPWNWVSKKGTSGDIYGINNSWFYRWNNQGVSDLNRECTPMSWGYGGANDDSDIELYISKYKTTHVLGFNEPDDCNGQSGQYNNMCDVETALDVYENLMKTGLRLVSPACRQNSVFNWLDSFNNLAVQNDIRIDVIAVHWYDWNSDPQNSPNADPLSIFNRFKSYLNQVFDNYGLPIWITEFNANKYRTTEVNHQFMALALPYLESLDYVERYSWFEPVSGVADFFDSDMELTDIGILYNTQFSTPSIPENSYTGPDNLNSISLENNYEYLCDTENTLSAYEPIVIDSINVIITPNPASNLIKIISNNPIINFSLYDMYGNKIEKKINDSSINIGDLPTGIYLINLNNKQLKLIKK